MANKNSDDSFKSNLIMAFIAGLFVIFSVLAGYILTRLSAHDDVLRDHEGRIAKLEARVDGLKPMRIKNIGGYEWGEYPSEEKDEEGKIKLSVEIDVLEKQYRWVCGRFTSDDIVKADHADGKLSLDEIIKKYDPDVELKRAKKIIVIGTASSEGDTPSQEDLARQRAETLVTVVKNNLQKNIPIIGMSFGQYVANREKAECSDATSEQRRILIVKIIKQSAQMSDDELEKSLVRRFKQLASEESYEFPVDIRNYSNYRQGKRMFLE